jgi:predicted permease
MTVIALLIFLACSNVANLLLANAAGRRREIGTRLALGASRARIVRQLLTESVLLGAAGGTAGLALAGWLAPLLARALRVPPLLDVEPDLRVYIFAAGVTILAGVLAGLAPARYGRRGDLLGALQADRAAGPASLSSSRTRTVLIGAQAAGSIVLLVVAALFTRSLVQALSFELGFDPERLVSVSVGFGRGYDGPRTATYWDAALDRVRQMPDVAAASLAAIAPFGDAYAPDRPAGGAGPHRYLLRNEVSAEFFQTAGIRVLHGRTFTRDEVSGQAPVAVISAELARAYWKDEEPVGSTLDRVWGHRDGPEARGLVRKPAGTRIIGVVADTITRFGSYDAPIIYLPLSSETIGAARMIVSMRGDPAPGARRIEEALLALDPGLHPATVLVRDGVKRELELPAAVAATTGILSITAVALAAIGIFGVTAFVVGQRRHEISVRMALGATGRAIVGMLLRDGLRPVFVGMLSGLALAALAGQVIRRVLYGVAGHDPIAIAASVLILCTAASAAVWIPARQAARTSPAEMLKEV